MRLTKYTFSYTVRFSPHLITAFIPFFSSESPHENQHKHVEKIIKCKISDPTSVLYIDLKQRVLQLLNVRRQLERCEKIRFTEDFIFL